MGVLEKFYHSKLSINGFFNRFLMNEVWWKFYNKSSIKLSSSPINEYSIVAIKTRNCFSLNSPGC